MNVKVNLPASGKEFISKHEFQNLAMIVYLCANNVGGQ